MPEVLIVHHNFHVSEIVVCADYQPSLFVVIVADVVVAVIVVVVVAVVVFQSFSRVVASFAAQRRKRTWIQQVACLKAVLYLQKHHDES